MVYFNYRWLIHSVYSLTIAMVSLLLIVMAHPASAGDKDRTKIRIQSEHGHKTITAQVRGTARGRQVRLPGGTWIWCEGDCRQAVRHQYLDFWERQRELTAHIGP